AMSWRDEDGNFWLFGGQGYDTSWNWYEYGDLWKFDGEDWTWVSGPQNTFQAPVYGTLGQFGAANTPGSRSDACTTLDDQGDLWLFGGYYYDANAGWEMVHLTDLWKFNGSQWAWMGGSQDKDILGVFGTKGIYAAENTPPSLKDCSLFATADDEIILFGGRIIDDSTGYEYVYYDAPDGVLNLANGLGFLDTADLMQI
ncbi:MAG: hypothetical protein KBD78_14800, partial [Oligoflexales bacterium]|nr:hypothetical protein [Oligoflexales bacterium]